jgi:hypothetical protein
MGRYARFEAPDRPINAARFRSVGLEVEGRTGETVPGSATPDDPKVLPGQTHANEDFYGIRSRSRFHSPLYNPPVGHGGPTSGVTPGPRLPDPGAGRSQFDEREVEPFRRGLSASSLREVSPELNPSLGQEDVKLAREGVLRFARPDYGVSNVGAQPIIGPPSWYAAGPIPPSLRVARRGTLRREFMQWAQTFFGRHAVQTHKAPGSTSPVRMAAARTNRLTERRLPASFGSTTEVLR